MKGGATDSEPIEHTETLSKGDDQSSDGIEVAELQDQECDADMAPDNDHPVRQQIIGAATSSEHSDRASSQIPNLLTTNR